MKDEIIMLIVKWMVPFLLGAMVTAIPAFFFNMRLIKNGLQCLLRVKIIETHDKYVEKSYCPIAIKESTVRLYKAYHALRGNDVATSLYNEIMDLPIEPPKQR
ncbi:MAG: hypothetical protein PUB43_01565 [Oscillospiraceae bacterium]|nr:hypothetical protein [Oscillospiraceae bacterium]